MVSLPTSFSVGSAHSGSSFKDAVASYRRSQYLLSNAEAISSSSAQLLEDEETGDFAPLYESEVDNLPTPRPEDVAHDGMVSNVQRDDDATMTLNPSMRQVSGWDRGISIPPRRHEYPGPRRADERTPLLRKAISLTINTSTLTSTAPTKGRGHQESLSSAPAPAPKISHDPGLPEGSSTFGQTLFNAIAILLGIGMLSEPLAFAYAGWICGTLLIISYGFVTCYTAKILARIVLTDHRVRSYSDIGRKAFGPKSMPFISAMFCLELFSVSVILVTLYADSLSIVVPAFSSNTYKIMGIAVLVPMVFLPLSLLSYTSILGIICTVFLLAVIFIDGLSKRDAPGSLWSPAETDLGVGSLEQLGVAFGLFMAGFSGHAVMPSLARDMIDPSQFDTAMNYAFTFATFVYGIIGIAGYLMFGRDVSDEVSQNLLRVPGYNPWLNKIALWMLVLNPLSKFALSARPLNLTIETLLGINTGFIPPHDNDSGSGPKLAAKPNPRLFNWAFKRILLIFERVMLVCLAITVSILVPEFSSMMAILGSFSAFVLAVIGPVSAKVALERKCGLWDGFLLALASVMAIWGTGAAFLSTTD